MVQHRITSLSSAALLALAIGVASSTAQVPPPSLTTLHRFTGFTGDGSFPESGVLIGKSGELYGTTLSGGNLIGGVCPRDGCGTVFQMTPPAAPGTAWSESVIYSFSGSDGRGPSGGLVMGSQGQLYGTTSLGGSSDWGTVFELQPPAQTGGTWTLTPLYNFTPGDDGIAPVVGTLAIGKGGTLYGATRGASPCSAPPCGTVYSLTPPTAGSGPWTHTVLHTFIGGNGDGANPVGNLLYSPSGALFGTTAQGGSTLNGTVFQLRPPATPGGAWTETVLYNFTGLGGGSPNGVAFGRNGVLYGTTQFGGNVSSCGVYCGTVFELAPPNLAGGAWTQTILYSFPGTASGGFGWPVAAVAVSPDGALCGSTSAYRGTAFELQPPAAQGGAWTFVLLGSFVAPQQGGAVPSGPMSIDANGVIYGTTSEWNLTGGFGTVYKLIR